MGMVIRFPLEERIGHKALGAGLEPATVVILPVVRIERHTDEPSGDVPRRRQHAGPGTSPPRHAVLAHVPAKWIPVRRRHAPRDTLTSRPCSLGSHDVAPAGSRHAACAAKESSPSRFCSPAASAISAGRARRSSATAAPRGWESRRRPRSANYGVAVSPDRGRDPDARARLQPDHAALRPRPLERRAVRLCPQRRRCRSSGRPMCAPVYGPQLISAAYPSATARYARLIDDIRNDIVRIDPFDSRRRARRDLDRKRGQSLAYVSTVAAVEVVNARLRIAENAMIADWVRWCLDRARRRLSLRARAPRHRPAVAGRGRSGTSVGATRAAHRRDDCRSGGGGREVANSEVATISE